MKANKYTLLILIIVFGFNLNIFSYPTGFTGRTKKTNSIGCGSCHLSGTTTTATITGPDTVVAGTTTNFTITYSGTNSGNYGIDISAKYGTLSPGSSSSLLQLLNEELTHIAPLTTTSLTFSYTASVVPGKDSLFATVVKGYVGKWNWAPNKGIVIKPSIGIRKISSDVFDFRLEQNYPNPFNPATNIKWEMYKTGIASIVVYNIQGQEILTLIKENLLPGVYDIKFDASELTSGVYFYKLIVNDFVDVKKMTFLK